MPQKNKLQEITNGKVSVNKIPFGIPEIDQAISLSTGQVHEWALEDSFSSQGKNFWYPPLQIISHLVGSYISTDKNLLTGVVAWVGKKCWPSPQTLNLTFPSDKIWPWKKHFLFLTPSNKEERLWSIIQLLRSSAVLAVIADGSGFNLTATRRLQLACEERVPLLFLMRPPWELKLPSSGRTKWSLTPLNSQSNQPAWQLELVKAKGNVSPLSWKIEWVEENGKSALYLLSDRRTENFFQRTTKSALAAS